MAAVSLTLEDMTPFLGEENPKKVQLMIDDALAQAKAIAPCISDESFIYADAAKAIIRNAIVRWIETGAGGVTMEVTGPYTLMRDGQAAQKRKGAFYPSEIKELQRLCGKTRRFFTVDQTPLGGGLV